MTALALRGISFPGNQLGTPGSVLCCEGRCLNHGQPRATKKLLGSRSVFWNGAGSALARLCQFSRGGDSCCFLHSAPHEIAGEARAEYLFSQSRSAKGWMDADIFSGMRARGAKEA